MAHAERRHQPREAVRADLWLGGDDTFTRHPGSVRDLSVEGAFLDLDVPVTIGDTLRMRLRLERSGEFITCDAIVRHTRDPRGMGVEFTDLDDHARERIRAFLDPEGAADL